MSSTTITTPRPMPSLLLPAAAGALVLALALPVFLVTGWPIGGWLLAATLWAAGHALGFVLTRLRVGAPGLAGSGVLAFGMMFRGIAVMVVLVAVAVSRPHVALGAAILYALAYTLELGLSVVAYFSGPSS